MIDFSFELASRHRQIYVKSRQNATRILYTQDTAPLAIKPIAILNRENKNSMLNAGQHECLQ